MDGKQQLTLGIDLGGTSTRVGLYDCSMQLLDSSRMPTRVLAGPQACVEEMAGTVRGLLRRNAVATSRLLGIGIGSPGPINLRTGILGMLPNLPGWDNFPLRDALAEATGLPTILESDANAAAIAEWKLGAGMEAGLTSMAMLTLGTGVGSGLILGGRVWHGMFGMGGEVGHATVAPDGLLCSCGSRGCLEMYASANGLLRFAQAIADSADGSPQLKELVRQPGEFTPQQIAELAEAQGDPGARLAFAQLGWHLGIGIANLISTLDPPMIVIGGGLASAWALFAPEMFRSIREYSVVYRLVAPAQMETREINCTFICPAQLGPAAGLVGAALLPRLTELAIEPDHIALTSEVAT